MVIDVTGVPKEGLGILGQIDWVILEIRGFETARNGYIMVVVAIVSSYSDCTAEGYIGLRSMGVEINYIMQHFW